VRRLIVLGALVVAASACGSGGRGPTLLVRPDPSLEDQPVTIEATGFPPNQRVTLTLGSTDVKGVRFAVHATFRADEHGTVDVARQATLLASMSSGSSFYYWSSRPRTFRVTATVAGKVRATTTFHRRWSAIDYTEQRLTVSRDGIHGTFFAPAGAGHRAAVLAFGGSEGGDDDFTAERLAAHGIPTLSLGYFHAPGLPDRLVNIPLEYFHRALLWLDRRPQVDRARVSIVTGSYGSEAALLLGAHYPTLIHKIDATLPGGVVTCGIVGAHREKHLCLGSPWTFQGRPVPFTREFDVPLPIDEPRAVIPVERIRAQLLLACGGEDATWTSCPYADAIVARRRKAGEKTTLYTYPRAGHFVGASAFAYEPGAMTTDTTVPWTEQGREDLWPRVLAFVRR
jgi:dienelactone hydrolase